MTRNIAGCYFKRIGEADRAVIVRELVDKGKLEKWRKEWRESGFSEDDLKESEELGMKGLQDQILGCLSGNKKDCGPTRYFLFDDFEDRVKGILSRRLEARLIQDPESVKTLAQMNSEVAKRRSYGRRTEAAPGDENCLLSWSNGSADWWSRSGYMGKRISKGDEVNLDANEILVPHSCDEVIELACLLDDLPLYGCSTEAKERGEVDPMEASVCWALKQMQRAEFEEFQKKGK